MSGHSCSHPCRSLTASRRTGSVWACSRWAVLFDEWETVYRQRLQVERDLLAGEVEASVVHGTARERAPTAVERVVAVGTIALIVADATLLLANLVRPYKRRR